MLNKFTKYFVKYLKDTRDNLLWFLAVSAERARLNIVLYQGIASLTLAVTILLFSAFLIFPFESAPSEIAYLKAQTLMGPVVAGQKVKWVATINREDITASEHFVKLPKTASKIKVKTLARSDAVRYVASLQGAKHDRAQLAKASEFKPRNVLMAGLAKGLEKALEKAAGQAIDAIAEALDKKVAKTKDSKFVDISSEQEPEEIQGSNDIVLDLPEQAGSNDTIPSSPESEEVVIVEYETPAPEITEESTSSGKLITISSSDEPQLTDVLAYTTIPEIYKVGQEDKIKIKWLNEDGEEMPFTAFDLNNNGKLDYIEWTVPHLSEQVFEIIFISKAWKLDSNLEIQEDIYEQVSQNEQTWQENTYSTVEQGNYVRVTFEQILNNTKDITIHMRPNPSTSSGLSATIEVYPVYTDEQGNQTQGEKIAEFPAIDRESTYKIYLTELQEPTDKFDLKVVAGY